MKFSRLKKIETLKEGKTYTGIIFDIIKKSNCNYYEIQVKTDTGIISIWVNDSITPEHPLFEVFDAFIENEEDAEDFDEKDIIGTTIEFTVKNLPTHNKKQDVEVERTFFDKVTPIFEETEEEEDNE